MSLSNLYAYVVELIDFLVVREVWCVKNFWGWRQAGGGDRPGETVNVNMVGDIFNRGGRTSKCSFYSIDNSQPQPYFMDN